MGRRRYPIPRTVVEGWTLVPVPSARQGASMVLKPTTRQTRVGFLRQEVHFWPSEPWAADHLRWRHLRLGYVSHSHSLVTLHHLLLLRWLCWPRYPVISSPIEAHNQAYYGTPPPPPSTCERLQHSSCRLRRVFYPATSAAAGSEEARRAQRYPTGCPS